MNQAQVKLIPQLPLPNNFYSSMNFGSYMPSFAQKCELLDDSERLQILSFLNPYLASYYQNTSNKMIELPFNASTDFAMHPRLNEVSSSLLKSSCCGDHQEHSTEVKSLNSYIKDSEHYVSSNTKLTSDVISSEGNKFDENPPSKEDLYNLSTLIQNTTPDFQNIFSGDMDSYLDECYLTKNSVYISKTISGFNW